MTLSILTHYVHCGMLQVDVPEVINPLLEVADLIDGQLWVAGNRVLINLNLARQFPCDRVFSCRFLFCFLFVCCCCFFGGSMGKTNEIIVSFKGKWELELFCGFLSLWSEV